MSTLYSFVKSVVNLLKNYRVSSFIIIYMLINFP